MVCCVAACPGVAVAGGCPDEAARGKQVRGVDLPDCREYEQVSPVNKNDVDAHGFPGAVEASLSGDRVSYFSVTPFPEGCAPVGGLPTYISSQGAGGAWSTEEIFPCEASEAEDLGVSEDLSEVEIEAFAALTPQALPGRNFYVRYTEPSGGERYRWLAHTTAGGTEEFELFFAGFSGDDQHLLVETEEPLAAGAVAKAPNVFEANLEAPATSEQWSLVGMIPPDEHESCQDPACEPSPDGAVAGLGAYAWPAIGRKRHYTQSAISRNGSLVFFTALPSERLYVREDGHSTSAVSEGAAHFRTATPDGAFAFYTEGENLYRYDTLTHTREAIATPVTPTATGNVTKGSNLITGLDVSKGVFRVGEELFGAGLKRGTTITAVDEPEHMLTISLEVTETLSGDALSGTPGAVAGVLGVSAEGSIVYFVAAGVLATNTREYEYVNAEGDREKASESAANEPDSESVNLYASYLPPEGTPVTTFIARLDDTGVEGGDQADWDDYIGAGFPNVEKLSRLTTDGETLLLASREPLTGYDNSGPCGGVCSELFRYRAGPEGSLGRLTCVSCNPDPAIKPRGDALLAGEGGGIRGGAGAWLSRNLSADGDRVFFETPDALLPADTDTGPTPGCIPPGIGTVTGCDVYEWETDGEGSCQSETQDEGCLFLISSGTSSEQSYFGDASANGDDVFFFTRQALVPTDTDNNVDVYDARVCIKEEPCEETPHVAPAECNDEGCAGPHEPPPPPPNLATANPTGTGNLPEPPTPSPQPPPKLTTKQKLAVALKACRTKHNKHKRATCEARAHKRYPVKATKSSKREERLPSPRGLAAQRPPEDVSVLGGPCRWGRDEVDSIWFKSIC